MGNKPSFMLQDEEIKSISEETGFTPSQVERLYSRFTALDKSGNGSLSRQDCLAIPELAINPLCDRIVQMFFVDCDDDHDRINFRQFMKVLATFRSSNKSTPLSRSRAASRQESLSKLQQQQLLFGQASMLFDSLDSHPLSSVLSRHTTASRHSRHSSFHGFNHINSYNYNNQPQPQYYHHTTNQHSVHYAASLTHLPSSNHLFYNTNNNINSNNNNNNFANYYNNNQESNYTNSNFTFKKPQPLHLVDPDEPANSKKHKLHFMFKVYDVNNDNLIDIEDLISIIKMMCGTYIDDERVKKIAETTLKEADKNCDGYIDFEEFCKSFSQGNSRKDSIESLKVKFPHSYVAYSAHPTHLFTRLFSTN